MVHMVHLQAADGASALIALHGGQVLSWQPAGGPGEQLYLSPRSGFGGARAIRGGVPVVFPQFSDRGPLPKHGFARTSAWRLHAAREDADGGARAELRLADDAQTRALWPHAFTLALEVRVCGRLLDVALTCRNTGERPWQCTAALHTYLRVHDSTQAQLAGLGARPYFDAVLACDAVQHEALLRFPGEVDRVYAGVDAPLLLHDVGAAEPRSVQVEQRGFADVVVWNPGAQRCAALPDMPADGYRNMVCIEAARIAQPIVLAVGQAWTGAQRLSLTVAAR